MGLRVLVTLDYLDGTSRIAGPLWADEINLHGLLFKLTTRGVAGVTFTNAEPLTELLETEREKELNDE